MKQSKNNDFVLSKEALDEHIKFLEEKDPSIMGKTCQMLSALKINLNPKEGTRFLYNIIADMKRSDEQTNELLLQSIDKYLPKRPYLRFHRSPRACLP